MPPLTVDVFPVALETASEPPPPHATTASCNINTTTVKEPQTSESEAEMPGEKGEKEGGEGQWYAPSKLLLPKTLRTLCYY